MPDSRSDWSGRSGEGGTLRFLWIAPAIIAAAMAFALIDTGSGVPAWLRMRADLHSAQQRMAGLEREIAEAEAESGSLGEDSFAIERAIREDLGLARPGEMVMRLADPAAETPRLP